jgi:hypothetical protein
MSHSSSSQSIGSFSFGPWPGFCLEVGVATGRDSGGVEEVVGGFALAASRSSRHFFFAPVTTGSEVEVEEEVEEEEAEDVADPAAFLADSSLIFFSQIFFSPGKE